MFLVSNGLDSYLFYYYYLIDIITREPPWGESETCLECGMKFTITNRRHHWFGIFEFIFSKIII